MTPGETRGSLGWRAFVTRADSLLVFNEQNINVFFLLSSGRTGLIAATRLRLFCYFLLLPQPLPWPLPIRGGEVVSSERTFVTFFCCHSPSPGPSPFGAGR